MNPIGPRVVLRDGESLCGVTLVADEHPNGRVLFTESAVGVGVEVRGADVVLTKCTVVGFGECGVRLHKDVWRAA